jgi:aryl-alcohol dehydrogenase-like predicted oxidoreductase
MRFSRRDLLRIAAGTSASLAAGWRPAWALIPSELILRTIPATGEQVPAIGLGGRNYRAGPSAEERAPFRDTIATFVRLGGKVIDTAPSYGNSEEMIGGFLAELGARDKVFLASKVDRDDATASRAQVGQALKNLQTARIDLMQVHNLTAVPANMAMLRELKAEGTIRYTGITTGSERQYPALAEAMVQEKPDFIQLDYALDNREAADRLLPLAQERGIAVLVNLPFGRGRLFRAVGEQVLPDWATEIGCRSWAQVFLKYVISHPAVTTVIPGTTKPHHAEDNIGAGMGPLPDAAMRRRMEAFADALPG